MSKLHLEAYTGALSGKDIVVACREGILRDHFEHIVSDLKFLARQGMKTALIHNMSNRFANQKHFQRLADRLPETHIIRLMPDTDFYQQVLDRTDTAFKLVFLERRFLQDQKGRKINAISTQLISDVAGWVGNVNFRNALDRICQKIDAGIYNRVHIVPAGRQTLRKELLTIEGAGTLIANNFTETFAPLTMAGLPLVAAMLDQYSKEGLIKPRDRQYLLEHLPFFYVTRIDDIVVGCVEEKPVDQDTVELGALAIATKFRNQRVGVFTVNAFIREMKTKGYHRFISLTRNIKLQQLYLSLGFRQETPEAFKARQAQSPGVPMYYFELA
ncbi:MAG: GNAT family N-acetyltransferase [Pseudomonadota bacterium]